MRCGRCGGLTFSIMVRPRKEDDRARVRDIVCDGCRKIFKVDDEALVEGDGKVDLAR